MGEEKRKLLGKDVLFLAVIVAVISMFVFLSVTGKKRFISPTQAHLDVAWVRDNADADAICGSCHAVDADAVVSVASAGPPLPESHPLRKKNCRQCHRLDRKNP